MKNYKITLRKIYYVDLTLSAENRQDAFEKAERKADAIAFDRSAELVDIVSVEEIN